MVLRLQEASICVIITTKLLSLEGGSRNCNAPSTLSPENVKVQILAYQTFANVSLAFQNYFLSTVTVVVLGKEENIFRVSQNFNFAISPASKIQI